MSLTIADNAFIASHIGYAQSDIRSAQTRAAILLVDIVVSCHPSIRMTVSDAKTLKEYSDYMSGGEEN